MRFLKPTLVLFISVILFVSCSSDDAPSQPNESAQVIGSYTLSAVNINQAQDVNEDGTASTNLLDEMNCITGTLAINTDNSWSLNVIRVNVTDITGGLFFIACGDSDSSKGTWTFSNNQLSLNGSFEPTIYVLNGDTLTRQIGEDLPSFQSFAYTKN
ncbi:hypothetical protein [Maribacter sp. 2308TA10-17]|uniref:hypothetical protein n=1 Tax=Maribacter sp. 2308TA10-17 TaxID=3386276 RepID=UPI0039BD51E4